MSTPRIAIIGAGFSGIGMAVQLLRQGCTSFTVYERLAEPGGCWRANRFPGAEVDTESDVYRFSFKPYPWSRSHARRAELLQYFEDVVAEYGLEGHFQFGTAITAARWDDAQQGYTLTIADGTQIHADVVISAVGLFSEPQTPSWPGLETFRGQVAHTAQWNDEIDLVGKRVAVVGVGSTGASLVPAVAPLAERLYVFQREPGWILPKPVKEFASDERARRARHIAAQINRAKALYRIRKAISGGRAKKVGTAQNRSVEQTARSFLEREFTDRPDLLAALTPSYPIYGKRVVRSSDFYPALKLPHVELVPHNVVRATETSLVDDQGVEREVDVIAFATGFRASRFLSGLTVIGRDGVDLHTDAWRADPSAYLGLMVPGFPNFFMLYGPNTNGSGAHLFVLECQMKFVGGVIRRMRRSRATAADVRPRHVQAYERWLGRQWTDSALLTTRNYFRSETGNVVTNWPRGFGLYYLLTKITRYVSVRLSRGGRRVDAPVRRVETADVATAAHEGTAR